jgi:hypothetical protein
VRAWITGGTIPPFVVIRTALFPLIIKSLRRNLVRSTVTCLGLGGIRHHGAGGFLYTVHEKSRKSGQEYRSCVILRESWIATSHFPFDSCGLRLSSVQPLS